MVEAGQFDQIKAYCAANGYQPNYLKILKGVLDSGLSDRAVELGKMLCNRGPDGKGTPAVPLNTVFDLFLQYNRVTELTNIMLDALKTNRPEDGPAQTKLLELCISRDPNLAASILQSKGFSYFDKPKIARACEQMGLLGYALENYTELADIRRVIVNTHMLNKEQLISFLCSLDAEKAKTCLGDMIRASPHNVLVPAEAAVKMTESGSIQPEDIVSIFESLGSIDGMFMYLRQIISTADDPDIIFKYIEAAAKLNHLTELESIIRTNQNYDPEKVKNFLMETKLQNPKALIYLCDAHEYIEEMTKYLYKNNFISYINVYLTSVNPQAAPKVLAALLDMECEESTIKNYLANIRMCPLDQLVEAFESRNRLRMLQGWLEARASEGNQSSELHTALAKIYIDTNKDADNFLINNAFYDPKVVGKYCEEREPLKAYLAYKKGGPSCDMDLIEVTNKNMLYKLQANYLVERKDPELWKVVLDEENPHRKRLVEQIVQTALPDTNNADEVAVTVKAFADAGLHHELIEILDKIVLHRADFAKYNNLKTMLILTAIKSEPSRVMDYVNRLEDYNAPKLAQKAIEHGLYEEAFAMYVKVGNNDEAVNILLTYIKDLARAQTFAEKIGQPALWSRLGQAYLMEEQVVEAIKCFITAGDPKSFMLVIGSAERQGKFDHLIDFLLMARQKLKDSQIDGALIYAYAKSQRLTDLENFLNSTNSANIEQSGDRCYNEGLFEAARMLYSQIGKLGKLASCLVNLGQYQAAIDAAKKAESPKTWEEVNCACVKAKQFQLAAIAGLKIMVHPDRLEVLVNIYEKYGYWEELIKLLDSGLALEQAHNGIFTELGILLAKYVPGRLMDHLRTYFQRLHITKVLKACEDYQLWKEAVFLHSHYGQSDSAINIMIEHSPTAWEHDIFIQNIQKAASSDLYYKSIKFYLEEQPMLLNELLTSIANKLDLTKTVALLKQNGATPLTQPFLKSVQTYNVQAVNEELNELYLESDDYESLRVSVSEYDKFDHLVLADRLKEHELLEFRRIAALLYKQNKRYADSISLSKNDEQYKDAIDTALESKNGEIAEGLLRYFVSINKSECFAACLYTCYELIEPDVVVELAWRNGLMEFAFPFFIQSMRDLRNEVGTLNKKVDTLQRNEEKKAKEQANIGAQNFMPQPYPQIMAPGDRMSAFGGGPADPMGGMPSAGGGFGGMGLQFP
jgi:clathrin heavy chain